MSMLAPLPTGKGESVLDHVYHSRDLAGVVANADVAADSYHRFKEDVAAARELKVCP